MIILSLSYYRIMDITIEGESSKVASEKRRNETGRQHPILFVKGIEMKS